MMTNPQKIVLKPPPPVPPRPSRALVAEALAKTRRNFAEKNRNPTERTVIYQSSESIPSIQKSCDEDVHVKNTSLLIDDILVTERIPIPVLNTDSGNETSNSSSSERSTFERQQQSNSFDDTLNHELLISELEDLRLEHEPMVKIQQNDWLTVCHNNSCQITITNCNTSQIFDNDRLRKMSNLNGLPPLPKSLSGYNVLNEVGTPQFQRLTNGVAPSSGMDAQLAILRREMFSLRQLDLSLLSQLWSLNESIQEFRQILQEREDRILVPNSPLPSSEEDSNGDDNDDDDLLTESTQQPHHDNFNSNKKAPPSQFKHRNHHHPNTPPPPPPPLIRRPF